LGNYLSLELPDALEHHSAVPDLLFVGPFVGHRDPEVDRQNYALVSSLPCAQRRSGGQRVLGVDDAVTGLGEASPQRIVEEHFMPVPVPDNASWTAEWLEYEAEAENWYSQQPTP
jgi:hypothetical protein